jgi:hypothetical protein
MKRTCAGLLVGLSLIVGEIAAEAQTVLFGPREYAREEGKPKEIKDRFFLCSPGAAYTVVVQFGPGETKPDKEKGHGKKDKGHEAKVTSAEIELNGKKVVSPHEFKRKGETIRKAVSLKEDNTLEVELHGEPGGAVTVWIECEDCIKLMIDEPAPGAALDQAQALVRGHVVTQAPEVGIAAGGILGHVSGDAYAALVPLKAGENVLTVRATDACGGYASQTVTIHSTADKIPARLSPLPSSGLAPLNVAFEASAGFAPASYQWDLEGDGTIDQQGSTLSKTTFTYISPGLYFPTVTLTGPQGQSATATAVVNVLSKDEMDVLLKGKWEGMRQALKGGDLERALNYFERRSRATYEKQFTALRPVLGEVGAEMGEIVLARLEEGWAEYEIIAARNGITSSFHLLFVRDHDGLWRIKVF